MSKVQLLRTKKASDPCVLLGREGFQTISRCCGQRPMLCRYLTTVRADCAAGVYSVSGHVRHGGVPQAAWEVLRPDISTAKGFGAG